MSVTIQDLSLREITPDLDSLPRLENLRKLHFDTKAEICVELPLLMTQYLKKFDNPGDSPELRAGKMYKYILENKRVVFHDDNLLAGTTTTKRKGVLLHPDAYAITIWPELETISQRPMNPFDISEKEIERLNLEIFPFWLERTLPEVARRVYDNPRCQQLMERIIFYLVTKEHVISHTIPDYAAVVNKGLLEIIKEAEERGNAANDQETRDFYRAVQLSLEGILAYADKLSQEAARKARSEYNQARRDELLKISEVCRRVPAHPPRSFREAVNAMWICKVALHQETPNIALSLGRLDQVLYPAFEEDLKQSRRDGREEEFLKEAIELVGCLWLKICDHMPVSPEAGEILFGGSGSNQAVTLGGVDLEGNLAVNDLTYIMLRATELLQLRDPNVNARYHPGLNGNPEIMQKNQAYLQRLCQVNLKTKATPCFHNDKAAIETLVAQGILLEHARDYGVVGCVEPSSSGRTFGHSGAIMMNLPAVLELALFQGKHRLTEGDQISPHETQAPELMTSFEDFKQAFKTQLEWLIDQAVIQNNNLGRVYQQHHPFPMLSALMEGCLKNGKDVIQGGAIYNSSGAAMIGLAEVVDSLTAIEEFVFGNGPNTVTFAEIITAINLNWEGYEPLQRRLVKSPHKFGTDSQLARQNADWLMKLLHDTFQNKEHYRNGTYTVGYWTMTTHAGFGYLTGALPSGRKKGEPFPSGITPVSGVAPQLNDVLDFVANLNHIWITNGQALNLKYTPGTSSAPKLAQCIETFFKAMGPAGGLQVQCNIIDSNTFEEARQFPERHRDLFVRVSGYSAYFVDLSDIMQKEIITRAEYDMDACS